MSLTSCKFFGSYYHSLVKHAPEQYGLFSGGISNTKKEETTFKSIKLFTNLTSNHHPNNILINALIRLECRDLLNNYPLSKQESKITNLYVEIKNNLKNTFFTVKWIQKYKRQHECFLKSVADYLLDSGIWWNENKDGVEFFDNGPVPENTSMTLTHFCSTTIKQQLSHISNCWERALLDKNNIIPAHSIEMKQSNQRTILTTLKYFSNNDPPTENSFMQITSELDDTVYPNTSRNSQTTIQYVPSPSIKLDLSSVSTTTDFITQMARMTFYMILPCPLNLKISP